MKVLLHICCGVCAGQVVLSLRKEGHEVTGLFFNPNIYPEEEYKRRLEAVKTVAVGMDFPLEIGEYQADKWSKVTEKLGNEPEGGRRCELCFKFRLEETYRMACADKFEAFTTTLSVSPRKSTVMVNRVGRNINKEMFLERDFKKEDGFKKTMELAKKHGIYRQNYCGCIYSRKAGT